MNGNIKPNHEFIDPIMKRRFGYIEKITCALEMISFLRRVGSVLCIDRNINKCINEDR